MQGNGTVLMEEENEKELKEIQGFSRFLFLSSDLENQHIPQSF